MAGLRLLDRVLGSLSGSPPVLTPEVLPPAPLPAVSTKPPAMPDLKKRWRKYEHALTHPLFHLSAQDQWTIGDSFEGTIITGDSGGGKTSGSGATISKAMLRKGYGGLVLTHKSDEVTRWRQYAKDTGREQDLLIVAPDSRWTFNFLNYQFLRAGDGAGYTENTVSAFMNVLESRYRGGRRQNSDAYWTDGARRLLRHSLDALQLAGELVTMDNILELVRSLPYPDQQSGAPKYQPDSYCKHCLEKARDQNLRAFFEKEFAAIGAEKQNAGIISTLTNMADPFMSGAVREIFCAGTTSFVPEFSRTGIIIILALPVLEWEEAGRTAQLLFKYIWQQAMLRRQGLPRGERPVFLWADEAQVFMTDFDRGFQEAARSSWAATVYLTQNINNLYAAMAPDHAQAHALLGNLGTKIFHRNSDSVTNQWAADTIGKGAIIRSSGGGSDSESTSGGGSYGAQSGWSNGRGGGHEQLSNSGGTQSGVNWGHSSSNSSNWGWQETIDYLIQPRVFTRLKGGGKDNNYQVQAIVFKAGRRFRRTGQTFIDVTFRQK